MSPWNNLQIFAAEVDLIPSIGDMVDTCLLGAHVGSFGGDGQSRKDVNAKVYVTLLTASIGS